MVNVGREVIKCGNFVSAITSVSQQTPALPIANPVVAQPSAAVPSPVAAVESSYFSTAAPYVPAQAPPPQLQQTRPLNEVISSVNSSFNFLQVMTRIDVG